MQLGSSEICVRAVCFRLPGLLVSDVKRNEGGEAIAPVMLDCGGGEPPGTPPPIVIWRRLLPKKPVASRCDSVLAPQNEDCVTSVETTNRAIHYANLRKPWADPRE
jgi:hypothetical protein